MLLLRGARAAATTRMAAARSKSTQTAITASGGRRRKGHGRDRGPARPQHDDIPTPKTAPNSTASCEETKKKQKQPAEKAAVRWKCASGCGACCKLDKGPDFPSPDEVFSDHPDHLQLYKSMIGPDGWCTNYCQATRTCNIYQDRPFFCRVEPEVFDEFFGVPRRSFHREACSACVDNIKMVYGSESVELANFKRVIREESNKHAQSKNKDTKLLDS